MITILEGVALGAALRAMYRPSVLLYPIPYRGEWSYIPSTQPLLVCDYIALLVCYYIPYPIGVRGAARPLCAASLYEMSTHFVAGVDA